STMQDFTRAIHDKDFFCGSEIRRFNLHFDNEVGGFRLDLALHWWPTAAAECEIPYSEYNRSEDGHRMVEYRFAAVSSVELAALNCSNGAQVYAVTHQEREWQLELAGGKIVFRSTGVTFLGESPCDDFGFQGEA